MKPEQDPPEDEAGATLDADPALEAELDRAMAPYEKLLSSAMAAAFRETLRDALLFHPVGRRFLNRVRPVPALVQSDVVSRRDPNTGEAKGGIHEDEEGPGKEGVG